MPGASPTKVELAVQVVIKVPLASLATNSSDTSSHSKGVGLSVKAYTVVPAVHVSNSTSAPVIVPSAFPQVAAVVVGEVTTIASAIEGIVPVTVATTTPNIVSVTVKVYEPGGNPIKSLVVCPAITAPELSVQT